MSTLVLTILTPKDHAQFKKSGTGSKKANMTRIMNLLKGLSVGTITGSLFAQGSTVDPVAASATATLVSCVTDTITIGKTTFTGTGSPTTSLHFETDGTDTADAAALAAAINAHTDTSKIVYATSALGVVTITALQKGLIGNHIVLSRTGSTITLTGSGYLASGAGGAADAIIQVV
jgi:phage tail sheath gpL-like